MTSTPPAEGFEIRSGEPLKPLTTFKIGGQARYFANVRNPRDLAEGISFAKKLNAQLFVLGGGSNVLISDAGFDGFVAHPANSGLDVLAEDADSVTLRVSAAETWDQVVAVAVERNWWGLENLSHIPGQAGAALVQNIGAYGRQISDVFVSADAFDLGERRAQTFDRAASGLAYRRSLFNTTGKGLFFIFSTTLKLSKHEQPNLDYVDVRQYFADRQIAYPTQLEIRQAIISIRDRKFPFPREERGGNAGSFFKNLILGGEDYSRLESHIQKNFGAAELTRLRELRSRFKTGDEIKIPSAFLMEICGLKGYEIGRAKVNETQPLVLLNQGGATAHDVMTLARQVRQTVYQKTGTVIEIEPELVGFSETELAHYLALE